MTKPILILCAMLLVGVAKADPAIDKLSTTITVITNVVYYPNVVTSPAVYYGWLDYLNVDLGGFHSPTVTVSLATYSMQGYPSRVLFFKSGMTVDACFPIREIVSTTNGVDATDAYASLPLFNEKLVLSVYGTGTTNAISVDAYPYIKP